MNAPKRQGKPKRQGNKYDRRLDALEQRVAIAEAMLRTAMEQAIVLAFCAPPPPSKRFRPVVNSNERYIG